MRWITVTKDWQHQRMHIVRQIMELSEYWDWSVRVKGEHWDA